jgi:hypothetical protein
MNKNRLLRAAGASKVLLRNPYVEFFNQTSKFGTIALSLSVKYKLGGRDFLIVANSANQTPILSPVTKNCCFFGAYTKICAVISRP